MDCSVEELCELCECDRDGFAALTEQKSVVQDCVTKKLDDVQESQLRLL